MHIAQISWQPTFGEYQPFLPTVPARIVFDHLIDAPTVPNLRKEDNVFVKII